MKKTLLTLLSAITASCSFATMATDFTANDCASNSHNLFTELAAGKVVVITWVMPCGACITGASNASNAVIAVGNPNVVFYLVDDYANTNCASLNSWASTNSITYNASFSNSTIMMSSYGSTGMPKTVVIGPNHFVSYNVSGAGSQTAIQTAINNSLTGVNEEPKADLGLNLFPNPATSSTKLTYTLTKKAEVSIVVMNELGEKVNTVSLGSQSAGKQEYELNIEKLSAGVYFIKLRAGEAVETMKLTVTK